MLSLGVCDLVETYFHRLGIMKEGGRIKHGIFRKKGVMELLSRQITSRPEDAKHLRRLVEIAADIEIERDDIAYGAPLSDEKTLEEKIELFLEMRKIIEKETGELDGTG